MDAPDLAVQVDASNPALLLARMVGGEAPAVQIDGDAQLAGDVNWLLLNLRWDVAADLERLGPIFVKFGQVLSTRRDLIPLDVADELARLQDRVPPFPAAQSRALVEKAFGRPIDAIFASFDAEPVASASIAQVHFAVLKDGREVAVKVLRPGMLDVIDHDMALLHLLARVEPESAPGSLPTRTRLGVRASILDIRTV